MNTLELSNYLAHKNATKKYFLGTFASDEIHKIKIKNLPCGLIANTDNSSQPGRHWICIFFTKDGTGEYFDSYGRKPNSNFTSFLKKHTNRVKFNNKRLQSNYSNVCGHYCLLFFLFKSLNHPQQKFLSLFDSKEWLKNDEKIIQLFNCNFENGQNLQKTKNCKIKQACCSIKKHKSKNSKSRI
jgi:hypothetical protein